MVFDMNRVECYWILKQSVGATPATNWFESGKPIPPFILSVPGYGYGVTDILGLQRWFESNNISYGSTPNMLVDSEGFRL